MKVSVHTASRIGTRLAIARVSRVRVSRRTLLLRRSRSFKVTDFGTNWKPICDFLLAINTNLHPISHRFEVIADYWSNLRFWQRGTPLWDTCSGWTPKLRTTKFILKKLEILLYGCSCIFSDQYSGRIASNATAVKMVQFLWRTLYTVLKFQVDRAFCGEEKREHILWKSGRKKKENSMACMSNNNMVCELWPRLDRPSASAALATVSVSAAVLRVLRTPVLSSSSSSRHRVISQLYFHMSTCQSGRHVDVLSPRRHVQLFTYWWKLHNVTWRRTGDSQGAAQWNVLLHSQRWYRHSHCRTSSYHVWSVIHVKNVPFYNSV